MFDRARALATLLGRKAGSDPAARARAACASFLARARFAERLAAVETALFVAWTALAALLALALGLDLALAPSGATRTLGALTGLAATSALLVLGVAVALFRRFSDRWLARRIEADAPLLDGRLLALVSDRRGSPAVSAFAPGLASDLGRVRSVSKPARARLHRAALRALVATGSAVLVIALYEGRASAQLGRALSLLDEPAKAP